MTNVRRPIHLQLKPNSLSVSSSPTTPNGLQAQQSRQKSTNLLAADPLPNQILPHLFVGNQEQTNRETLNRLNIGYILSLGLLPIVSNPSSSSLTSPTSTTGRAGTPTNNQTILLPNENTSIDFKVRVRTSNSTCTSAAHNSICFTPTTDPPATLNTPSPIRHSTYESVDNNANNNDQQNQRDENKGVRTVRSIYCKCINIADNSDQFLIKFFDEAYHFIDEARRKKCNILVHCLAGISRSPTVAIAYLMRLNSLSLQDAYNLVKKCRPQIDPNLSFMGQLMLYDKSLRQSRGTNKNNNNNNDTSNHQSNPNQYINSNNNVNNVQQQQHININHNGNNFKQQTQNSIYPHSCLCDKLRDS